MMRLMKLLMLSCRKATELMDKKLHIHLSPIENLQLFMHTRMCDGCRLYQKQGRVLDHILKRQTHEPENTNLLQKSLPPEAKSKIIKELEKM